MTNKRTYKKRQKLRTCETCGKALHISNYFKWGKSCIDCVAARNGGLIPCPRCNVEHPQSQYEIANDKSYRKKTCKSCCASADHTGASATTRKSGRKCIKCGRKAVDVWRGDPLCWACMNADVVTAREWHENHSTMGSAGGLCVDQDTTADRSRG